MITFRKKLYPIYLFGLFLIIFNSCGGEDEAIYDSVWSVVESNEDLSILHSELIEFDFDDLLSADTDEYTLFAPNDQAFADLLQALALPDFSLVHDHFRTEILAYHIHESKLLAQEIYKLDNISTLQGEYISGGSLLGSGITTDAGFITTDIQAKNGAVHIIDQVLIPPNLGDSNSCNFLCGKDFSILFDAVIKADEFAWATQKTTIWSILSANSQEGITVFATVNSVFESEDISVDSFTGEEWYELILNHIVSGIYGSEGIDFFAGQQITTYLGKNLTILTIDAPLGDFSSGVVIDSNGDTVHEAQIVLEDASISQNGTVHALGGVLYPQ